jgi:hypothetical protein
MANGARRSIQRTRRSAFASAYRRDMGGTVSKLDAALLIFLVSALSLSASVLYVWSLGIGLGIDFLRYLEIKDYLQITASWLCAPVVTYALLVSFYCLFRWDLKFKKGRIMPDRGWKLVSAWLRKISDWVMWSGTILIILVLLGLLFAYNPILAVASLLTFGMPLLFWWVPNSDNRGVVMKVESPFWPVIFRSLPAVYTSAFLLGLFIGPFAVHNFSNVSKIYLEGAGSQAVLGRIVFGMTKNLMFLRESDGEFIAIPFSKVQRIEMFRGP